MELVKKIKEAELKAAQMLEDAKSQAQANIDAAKVEFAEKLSDAGRDRIATIEKAQAQATAEATAQAEKIATEANEKVVAYETATKGKLSSAAAEVCTYVKSLGKC